MLPTSSRIRSAAALVAAVLLAGCSARIQHGLDERQANELQTVLAERGILAQKVPETGKKPTWALDVEEDQAQDAIRILAELGLPRPRTEGFGEIFGKGSLVPTPTEERALYMSALAGEVARTLESVDGVASARVHLVLPTPARPGQPASGGKAGAFIRVRPGQLERVERSKDGLKALIAGSIEGLSPEQVTLLITEVTSTVTVHPNPSRVSRLRALLILMGTLTSALGLLVVGLTLRLRQKRAVAKPPVQVELTQRPPVAVAVQPRKAA